MRDKARTRACYLNEITMFLCGVCIPLYFTWMDVVVILTTISATRYYELTYSAEVHNTAARSTPKLGLFTVVNPLLYILCGSLSYTSMYLRTRNATTRRRLASYPARVRH